MHGELSSIQANLEGKRKGSSTALIALHAFTGSDYNNTAAFFNKGKMKALKMLLESEDSDNYVSLFQGMSKGEEVKMEKFFCQLYVIKDVENVDSGRAFKLFSLAGAKLTSSGLTEPKLRSKVRKVNCSLLPSAPRF